MKTRVNHSVSIEITRKEVEQMILADMKNSGLIPAGFSDAYVRIPPAAAPWPTCEDVDKEVVAYVIATAPDHSPMDWPNVDKT